MAASLLQKLRPTVIEPLPGATTLFRVPRKPHFARRTAAMEILLESFSVTSWRCPKSEFNARLEAA